MIKKPISVKIKPNVPYKPTPHPMQHRLDEFRAEPSLWTPSKPVGGKS